MSLSSIITHSYPNNEEYFSLSLLDNKCWNCCNLLGHMVTDVFKYQWEKIQKMLLSVVKESYFCSEEILQKNWLEN